VSERTKAAMAHLKAQGKCCGQVPYGWNKTDGGNLVVNDAEQGWIDWMRARRNDGQSLRSIADTLNHRFIPTKSGNGRWAA
jgi:hypothetical protein